MLKMLHPNPTVQIPSWTLYDYQSPSDSDDDGGEFADPYSSDEFRMYEFKIRRCARGRAHDWTDCPYAHPGEKARRRDPRRFHYSGNPCPDFKKGSCARGDTCEFAHGVFECWLHPARYRTQPCKDGVGCRRRVCFFAHTPEQLRVLSPTAKGRVGVKDGYDGSPARRAAAVSPTSVMSPDMGSPPVSPDGLVMMMRRMRLGEGFGGLGFGGSSPATPTAKRAVFDLEGDGFDEIDVGWVSELVK